MSRSISLRTPALAALILTPVAQAHIGFTGDRTFNSGAPLTGGFSATVTTRTVSSSFGWADGTDGSWGDSHRNTYFRFFLSDTTTVSVSVARNDVGTQTGTAGLFLPAFSLYRIGTGTMPGGTHDSAVASVAYLTGLFGTGSDGLGGSGKEGSFNALGDWQIFSDTPTSALGDFRYVGHIADGSSTNYGLASGISDDGSADGFASVSFTNLIAGEYFIVVGGANYDAQNTETPIYGPSSNAYPSYGVSVSVTAIPEPASTAALASLGVLGFVAARRHRA
jgi:hypothetical protein